MRKIMAISAVLLLTACGQSEAMNMAMTECNKEAQSLPPAVSTEDFCSCVTDGLDENASGEELKAALETNTRTCREKAIEKMVGSD